MCAHHQLGFHSPPDIFSSVLPNSTFTAGKCDYLSYFTIIYQAVDWISRLFFFLNVNFKNILYIVTESLAEFKFLIEEALNRNSADRNERKESIIKNNKVRFDSGARASLYILYIRGIYNENVKLDDKINDAICKFIKPRPRQQTFRRT